MHINLENLPNYSRQHIIQRLVYRGDSLQAIHSLKDVKTRVLRYSDNKTNDHTLDLKWKRLKASDLGLPLSDDTVVDVSVLRELSFVPGSLKSFNGWTKTLNGVPNIPHEHVVSYHNEISPKHMFSANLIKKDFDRGCQFLEEQYIDLHLVHVQDIFSVLLHYSRVSNRRTPLPRYCFISLGYQKDAPPPPPSLGIVSFL